MWRRCWYSVDLNAVLSPPERDINYVSSGRKMPPRSQEHLVFLVRLTVSLQDYPLVRPRTPPVYIYRSRIPTPISTHRRRGSLNFLEVYKG